VTHGIAVAAAVLSLAAVPVVTLESAHGKGTSAGKHTANKRTVAQAQPKLGLLDGADVQISVQGLQFRDVGTVAMVHGLVGGRYETYRFVTRERVYFPNGVPTNARRVHYWPQSGPSTPLANGVLPRLRGLRHGLFEISPVRAPTLP